MFLVTKENVTKSVSRDIITKMVLGKLTGKKMRDDFLAQKTDKELVDFIQDEIKAAGIANLKFEADTLSNERNKQAVQIKLRHAMNLIDECFLIVRESLSDLVGEVISTNPTLPVTIQSDHITGEINDLTDYYQEVQDQITEFQSYIDDYFQDYEILKDDIISTEVYESHAATKRI